MTEHKFEFDDRPFVVPVRVKFYRVLTMPEPTKEWHRVHQLHVDMECARSRLHRRSSLIMQRFMVKDIPAGMYCAFCTRGLFKRVKGRYSMNSYRYDEVIRHWQGQFSREYETIVLPCEVVRANLTEGAA